jgi:hypothetical protein
MTWVDYLGALLAQRWFWPTFFGLTGFAGGLYLDAFMRRWVASQKKWLSSLKIFDLADPNLMNDAIRAEADNQEIMESIRKFQAERESLMPLAKHPLALVRLWPKARLAKLSGYFRQVSERPVSGAVRCSKPAKELE